MRDERDDSSGGESDGGRGVDGEGGMHSGGEERGGDMDTKRKRRLELNRKAAKESRRRKKMRIEELGRSVVFLTRENQELREQNELFRQMMATEVPPDSNLPLSKFQAENAALKMALYEAAKHDINLKDHTKKISASPGSLHSDGGHGANGGMSLTDHSVFGPLPSLAAAAAAVGNAPLPASGHVPSSLALLSSLPPLPPPIHNKGGGPGDKSIQQQQQQQQQQPSSNAMMMPSSLQRQSPSEAQNGNGKSNNGGRGQSESLLDAVGPSGSGSSAAGSRMVGAPGVGTPFMGGGMGVLASMGGVGQRDRDGSPPLSGQIGNGRGNGGRSMPPSSKAGYMSSVESGGGGSSSSGSARGGRSSGPSLLQQPDYADSGSYAAMASLHNAGRALDRGLGGSSASAGGGGGAGAAGPGAVGGPGGMDYAEMMARASANAAVARVRSMQQPHSDAGTGAPRDSSSVAGNVGGADTGSSSGSGNGRRTGGGGWPPSWPGREAGVGGGGVSTGGNVERL